MITTIRKRRWYQFSLRNMLAAFTLAAVALGFAVLPAERQHRAVQHVRALGGSVYYADPSPDESAAKVRLRGWLSRDYFDTVAEIDLVASDLTDADTAHFQGLTQVERLLLDDTKLTDAGLAHLDGLTRLRTLSLNNTRITDAGLSRLKRQPQLETLWLERTQITDAGLVFVAGHPQLKELYLNGTQLTDAGLPQLYELSQLRTLRLSGTFVTEAGMAKLKKALPKCSVWRL